MPALRDLLDFIIYQAAERGHSFGEECAREIETAIRKQWAGERVYIPPADSRQSVGRTEAIRQAAARLPTRVVAERFGVSRQWVHQVIRRPKK